MNLFAVPEIAAGYAKSRPPVHARIVERSRRFLPDSAVLALDVGCGAGVSTEVLHRYAERVAGIDPAEEMVHLARQTAPRAQFAVAPAESLPVRARRVDLLSAAGSLNYVDLPLFFKEAVRVLAPGGALLVYDFAPGRTFRSHSGLEDWFSEFQQKYPPPRHHGRALDPEVLATLAAGLQVVAGEPVEVSIPMAAAAYLNYMLSETNVALALRNGTAYPEIRGWCESTLAALWDGGDREVVFHGYLAVFRPAAIPQRGA